LAVLFAIFAVLSPGRFLSGENTQNVARQLSFNAIVAFGQVIVLIAGGIDLSVGSVLAMAAALAVGLQDYGVGTAVAAALLVGVGTGALNGWLVTKAKIPAFISTLGTMTGVYGLLLTYTQQRPISGQVEWFTLLGVASLGVTPVPVIFMLVLLVVFQLMLTYTRFGHNMYAVGSNEEAAYQAGIRVDRQRFWAFVISGFCAALAGVLLAARLNSASIHMGQETAILVLTGCIMGGASILGGRGSVVGAFLGMLALTILTNGMNLLSIFTYHQLAIRAILFIAVVAVDAFYVTTLRRRIAKSAA
jgi:ribose transport system permease protein